MRRFFFDVLDPRGMMPDDTGMEFESLEKARREAQRTVGEMVRDAMPDGDEHVTVIRVRDEGGKTLLMISNVMQTQHVE